MPKDALVIFACPINQYSALVDSFCLRVVFVVQFTCSSGFPVHGSTPQKYYLGGKSTSLVVPMEEEKQTLLDAQVLLFNNPDQTVMKFTKSLQEPNESEIIRGDNHIIWAQGIGFDSELTYHSERGATILNL